MPKVLDCGVYRDMTPEEIEAMEEAQEQVPAPVPTAEERLDAIESALKKGLNL